MYEEHANLCLLAIQLSLIHVQSKICFSVWAFHWHLAFCCKEKRGGVASCICGTEGCVLDSTVLFFHPSTALCLHLHSWPCNYCVQVIGLAAVPHPGIHCNFAFLFVSSLSVRTPLLGFSLWSTALYFQIQVWDFSQGFHHMHFTGAISCPACRLSHPAVFCFVLLSSPVSFHYHCSSTISM